MYVMRVVLHDWSDEKTVEILKSVRDAIGAAAPSPHVSLMQPYL